MIMADEKDKVIGKIAPPAPDRIYASMDDILAGGAADVEYKVIDGFKPGEKIRIGSVSAGDVIEWLETNEGDAKRTAGLRLLCRSLVGPEPANVRFADDDRNIIKFRAMRHNVTERIIHEIIALNGMSAKDDAKAKKD